MASDSTSKSGFLNRLVPSLPTAQGTDRDPIEINRLINEALIVTLRGGSAAIGVPAIFSTFTLAINYGWSPAYIALIMSLALLPLNYVLCKLSESFRAANPIVLLSLLSLVALSAYAAQGPYSGAFILQAIVPIMALFLLRYRSAFSFIGIFFLLIVVVSYWHTSGVVQPSIPGLSYPNDLGEWLRINLFTLGVAIAFALAGFNLKEFLLRALHRLADKEKELSETSSELGTILENLPDVYYRADTEGRVIIAKGAVQSLIGLTPEQAIGKKMSDFYTDPSYRDLYLQALAESGGKLNDYRVTILVDGAAKHTSSNTQYWRNEAGEIAGVEGTIRDISDAVETQQALLRVNQEISNLYNTMLDTVFQTGDRGEILMVSPSVEELLGYTPEYLTGKPITDFCARKETFLECQKIVTNQGFVKGFEGELISKNGESVWVSMTGSLDENGHFNAVVRDITQQKDNEEKIRQGQRFEALGRLTGGFAHNFNNLLGVVSGNAQMIGSQDNIELEVEQAVDNILSAVEKGTGLTNRLMVFSQNEDQKLIESVNANEIISNNMLMYRASLTSSFIIKTELMENCPIIEVDRNLLEDAILNLLLNSRDAMPEGGDITIRTSIVSSDYILETHGLQPVLPKFLKLEVEDTGAGMDKETISRATDPFFTTKKASGGMGIGLSTVYGFAKNSEGYFFLDSELNKGTRAQLFFPFK